MKFNKLHPHALVIETDSHSKLLISYETPVALITQDNICIELKPIYEHSRITKMHIRLFKEYYRPVATAYEKQSYFNRIGLILTTLLN